MCDEPGRWGKCRGRRERVPRRCCPHRPIPQNPIYARTRRSAAIFSSSIPTSHCCLRLRLGKSSRFVSKLKVVRACGVALQGPVLAGGRYAYQVATTSDNETSSKGEYALQCVNPHDGLRTIPTYTYSIDFDHRLDQQLDRTSSTHL